MNPAMRWLTWEGALQYHIMARIWTEYTAPDGTKYYYNAKTKRSTEEKPLSFFDTDDVRYNKKARLNITRRPYFVLPLANQWHLVICDNGDKFFHNDETKESVWELKDQQSLNLLREVDKQKLVLLVGIARGYCSPLDSTIYEEVWGELEAATPAMDAEYSSEKVAFDTSNDEEEVKTEMVDEDSMNDDSEDEDALFSRDVLVTGYSSSSEDEEQSEGETAQVSAEDDASDARLIGLHAIDEQPNDYDEQSSLGVKEELFELLKKYDCDPFSLWPMQLKKVQNDPIFYKITDDALKETLFEEWCQRTVESKSTQALEPGEEEEESENEDELEPTKFHYLAHIVAKSDIKDNTISQDIKSQNKSLFKRYKIKRFVKDKKEQDSFVSSLLFFFKKIELAERQSIFENLLRDNERVIVENISGQENKLRRILNDDDFSENKAYFIETQLLKLEKIIGIKGNLQDLADNTKYYVLGIKDKLIALKHYLKSLI